MAGDINLWDPGQRVSVSLVADDTGAVPERGDAVAISGQNRDGTEVSTVGAGDLGIGPLRELPVDYDPEGTYDAGEVVGTATVQLRHGIDWFETDADLAPGDLVEYAEGGGVAAFDTELGEYGPNVVGPVWTTYAKDEGTAGKVAVVRHH